ncbi:galactose-1-phosphate uridylyltransferase [Leucosporidium creatinivorum]|uniref:Galactose-1-phosphate uridylyltransferase n=1 Tax=Leucosporidium creatinivorum TaxID=106004 RepID=A0A1Y2D5A2_9BASI|nr:galactose-1-phosphate uridylyltransferase [Leucosporidium creatinivorum]
MSDAEIEGVVKAWTKLYVGVSSGNPWLKYIQIFENKGAMMGCSNPHPHGQAWSLSYIPSRPATILQSQRDYAHSQNPIPNVPLLANGKPSLLLNYAASELAKHQTGDEDSRVILVGKHFIALVPFWASWPFETMVLPFQRHIPSLAALTEEEATDLASTLGAVSRRMDNLFECSFGYSMGVYQAPVHRPSAAELDVNATAAEEADDWAAYAQLHVGFYPPLLRSSTVKKFLVGFELFAETQRDITPEQAAKRLRDCPDLHYKQRKE